MKHSKHVALAEGKDLFNNDESLAGFIGYLRVNIFIPHSRSLKERRQVLESITNRLKRGFNISFAQKPTDKWKSCELFFVCANYTKNYASNLMERIENSIRQEPCIHVLEVEKGVL